MVTMQRRISRHQNRYLVLKVEGLRFVKVWFEVPKCVPPDLTKLYQLLLHMVTMKGVIPVYLAHRMGYTDKLIDEAVAKGYVELRPVPKKPAEEVLKNIEKIAEASTGNV